jgi:hypothetical protein
MPNSPSFKIMKPDLETGSKNQYTTARRKKAENYCDVCARKRNFWESTSGRESGEYITRKIWCALGTMHWVLCSQVGIIRRRPASIHICLPSSWKSLPRSVTCNFQLLHARTTLIAFPLHICVSLLIWQHQQLMHKCTESLLLCFYYQRGSAK